MDPRDFSEGMKGDERGVSPVVATMLLIAITVVAVAGVAVYIRGLKPPRTAPSAGLAVSLVDNGYGVITSGGENYEADNDYIVIEHKGGDTVDLREVELHVKWAGGRAGLTKIDPLDDAFTDAGSGDFDTNCLFSAPKEIKIRAYTGENRLNPGHYWQYRFTPGDIYEVVMFHKPTETAIFRGTITARAKVG